MSLERGKMKVGSINLNSRYIRIAGRKVLQDGSVGLEGGYPNG